MLQDVRYACRSLRRAPGFTLVALLTLALGIGGTTAIFSVVDGILLRPLPYPDAGAVVRMTRSEDAGGFSPADYLDYRNGSRSFAALAAYRQDIVDLTGHGDPIRLFALETTGGFFDVFGVQPLAGRTYREASDPPDGPRVTVISEDFWETQLGRASDAVGSTIRLNAIPFTVIGIMPKTLVHPQKPDVWVLAPRDRPDGPDRGRRRPADDARRQLLRGRRPARRWHRPRSSQRRAPDDCPTDCARTRLLIPIR